MNEREIVYLVGAFKRNFHKVKSTLHEISAEGGFRTRIELNREAGRVIRVSPSEGLLDQLVLLMRKFLDPNSDISLERVWALLRTSYPDAISAEAAAAIDVSLQDNGSALIHIRVGDRDWTPREIYDSISAGGFFSVSDEASRTLSDLLTEPLLAPLVWQEFQSYNAHKFALASAIFDQVRLVERADRYRAIYAKVLPEKPRCIYCKSTSGKFTSVEHIVPEGMGNERLVLPRGYVCDRCNNVRLAALDKGLLEFAPIAALRTMFVMQTKQGKYPVARFANGRLRKIGPRHLSVDGLGASSADYCDWVDEAGQVRFKLQFEGARGGGDIVLLAQALYKIGLGMVAYESGHDAALDARYDAAREFIMTKANPSFRNYLGLVTEATVFNPGTITLQRMEVGTGVSFHYYGFGAVWNLEEEPKITNRFLPGAAPVSVFRLSNSIPEIP